MIYEKLKPFVFKQLTTRGFIINLHYGNEWTNIVHKGDVIGIIYEEPRTLKGLAPYRVALLVKVGAIVGVTHQLKYRFKTMQDAMDWCLEKQLAIFDQFELCVG